MTLDPLQAFKDFIDNYSPEAWERLQWIENRNPKFCPITDPLPDPDLFGRIRIDL